MTAPRILPEVVRRAREARALSRPGLALLMGIEEQALVKLEQPGHLVSAPQIEAVAKALGATVAELLEEYERARDMPERPTEELEPVQFHGGLGKPSVPGARREAQLRRLMAEEGGNKSAVARRLGVTRQAIEQAWKKLAQSDTST